MGDMKREWEGIDITDDAMVRLKSEMIAAKINAAINDSMADKNIRITQKL